jgi:hypothetical protein
VSSHAHVNGIQRHIRCTYAYRETTKAFRTLCMHPGRVFWELCARAHPSAASVNLPVNFYEFTIHFADLKTDVALTTGNPGKFRINIQTVVFFTQPCREPCVRGICIKGGSARWVLVKDHGNSSDLPGGWKSVYKQGKLEFHDRANPRAPTVGTRPKATTDTCARGSGPGGGQQARG